MLTTIIDAKLYVSFYLISLDIDETTSKLPRFKETVRKRI